MGFCVQPKKTSYRFFLLMAGGLFSAFGTRQLQIDGAGPLAVLTLAFVVNLKWRKDESTADKDVINNGLSFVNRFTTSLQSFL